MHSPRVSHEAQLAQAMRCGCLWDGEHIRGWLVLLGLPHPICKLRPGHLGSQPSIQYPLLTPLPALMLDSSPGHLGPTPGLQMPATPPSPTKTLKVPPRCLSPTPSLQFPLWPHLPSQTKLQDTVDLSPVCNLFYFLSSSFPPAPWTPPHDPWAWATGATVAGGGGDMPPPSNQFR